MALNLPGFIGILFGIAALAGVGYLNQNPHYTDADVTNYIEDNQDWLNSKVKHPVTKYNDATLISMIKEISDKVEKNTSDLVVHQAEIVKNKKLISEKAPLGSTPLIDKTQESPASLLTIRLDSNTFLIGEIIWISGKTVDAKMGIDAFITEPDGSKRTPHSVSDQNGEYKIAFTTDFENEIGEYSVYTKTSKNTSPVLKFELKGN
jgi:hypothetical protein